jgi:hypothetical protein
MPAEMWAALRVEEGSLYPALHRMEQAAWIAAGVHQRQPGASRWACRVPICLSVTSPTPASGSRDTASIRAHVPHALAR